MRLKALALGILSAVICTASATRAQVFSETQWFTENPAYLGGFYSVLLGPFPLSPGANALTSLDIGASGTQAEILVGYGSAVVWIDLEDGGASDFLDPAPPASLVALTAFDLVGSARVDLVGLSGGSLYVLDFDTLPLAWSAPDPLPFNAIHLAAANAAADPGIELVSSDGSDVWVRSAAGVWSVVAPQPPIAVEYLTGADLAFGLPEFVDPPSARLVSVQAGAIRYLYDAEPDVGLPKWIGPLAERFIRQDVAPVEPQVPPTTPATLALVQEIAPSPISFENASAALGLSAPFNPGGDGHCPGAVFSDLTQDGWPDLYLVRGSSPDPSNLLYVNDGAGGFNAADAGDAVSTDNGSGALALDFDNDGDRDLFVTNFNEPNALYENASGSYVDVTAATDPTPGDPAGDVQEGVGVGISLSGCEVGETPPCALDDTLAAGAGDFNRDGLVDLYIGNHLCCGFPEGERDVLYLNNGDGSFTDHTIAAGIALDTPGEQQRSTQALVIADINDDGWSDIYIAIKDSGPTRDQLFLNAGDPEGDGWNGFFTDWIASQPGLIGNVSGASMGVDVGDHDGDGDLDLFITDIGDMDFVRNTSESGTFGLELVAPNPIASTYWSWGTSWLDADNDSNLDLHVSTQAGLMDYLHRGFGDGNFVDDSYASGAGQAFDARASVPADYDRDGRLDLLVVNRDAQPIVVYHNQSSTPNNWLSVTLEGSPELNALYRSTRDAVGARIDVRTGAATQRRDISIGSHSCASTHDFAAHFGIGEAAVIDELRITWPSGRVSVHQNVTPNQHLTFTETSECGAADADSDGIGDSCECADVDDDGQLAAADLARIARNANAQEPALPAPDKCSFAGTERGCDDADFDIARRLLAQTLRPGQVACTPILP